MAWLLPEAERLASPNVWRGRGGFVPDVFILHNAVDGDDSPDDDELDDFADNRFGLSFAPRDPSHDCMDVARLFARPSREASTHFVVGRDGSKVQCVDTDDSAWGAGGGAFPRDGLGPLERPRAGEVNRRAIQVELCNAGFAVEKIRVPREARSAPMPHPGNRYKRLVWELYSDEQYATLEYLAGLLRQAAPTLRFVTGHEDVVNSHVLSKKHGRKVFGGKVDPGPAFGWARIDWRALGYTPVRYDFKTKAWVER